MNGKTILLHFLKRVAVLKAMWDYNEQRRNAILHISAEEFEAEALFIEAINRRVSFSEAVMRAKNIEARSKIAGRRLKWLLTLALRGGGDIRLFPVTISV